MRRICPLVLFVVLFLLAAQPALAQRRVALVIGNSIHETVPLKNPANDARAMAATLKALGFEVIHLENASQAVMEDAVKTLGRRLDKGSVGLFYFAGHGVQSAGRNYLIPVNSGISKESELEARAVDAGSVLESMEKSGSDLNIVILDACRNNPFAKKFRSMGAKGGLAAMQAPKGSLIAFATSPGAVASDGAGDHGIYTLHLLQHMRTPDLPVEQMFKRVRSGVITDTHNQQLPWETTSIQGEFAFAGAPEPQPAPQTLLAVQAAPAPAAVGAQQPQARSSSVLVEFAMLRENGKKPPTPVKTGDTLKSGDAYFFHIKASKDCHLYLFQVDSSGTVFRLFPNSEFHTGGNPIKGKARVTLPNEGEVFYLDQTTGKEEFYFLASQEPVPTLEELDGGSVDGIMRAGMTLRGPAGVKAAAGKVAAAGGEASAKVQEFTFSNSFVHAVAINHK